MIRCGSILMLLIVLYACRHHAKGENVRSEQSKQKELVHKQKSYKNENGWIIMSKISVLDFLKELKAEDTMDTELNVLTTMGQSGENWITESELEFLVSQIESKEKAKCVTRVISSFIPDSKNMTIGNHAISIIEVYRKKEAYPNELYICSSYDDHKVVELKDWWKSKKK